MPPLPAPLAAAFAEATSGGGKRERTQGQLLRAAVEVICERGFAGATMQLVAQKAHVTPATLYNNFGTKEALVLRLAAVLGHGFGRAINDSYAHITDGMERMAIGQRRYVRLAAESPAWALLLIDVMGAAPQVMKELAEYPLYDLRAGVKQKKFKVPSEAVALDVIAGVCTSAMRRVALGEAPPKHDVACATVVLRALGVPPDVAEEVASRPLPPLEPAAPAQVAAKPAKKAPPAKKAKR